MDISKKLAAEFIGTFWLVLGGCGAAVLAAGVPAVGIGYAGVALAFELTVVTGAYAFGHISGAHFNPAITIGVWAAGRFPAKDVLPYVVVQVIGRSRPLPFCMSSLAAKLASTPVRALPPTAMARTLRRAIRSRRHSSARS